MSDYLPQEVITNILLRLPVKSLVICTSVCKSWRSIIKDSSFIGAHLNRTINFNNHHGIHLLLLHRFISIRDHNSSVHGVKEEVYSLHYDNNAFDVCCEIGFQSPIDDTEMYNECFRVVGVCNGLVCLADDLEQYGYNFLIWNPSIKKLVTLPKPGLTFQTVGGYYAYHGFAFDAITNDYKVVRPVDYEYEWTEEGTQNQTSVEVYSLAAGSWSSPRIVDPRCSLLGQRLAQAFVNGALHWDAYRSGSKLHYILAVDVGSELFREIMMPKSLDWDLFKSWHGDLLLRLSVSGDGKSLALFMTYDGYINPNSLLDVWVMKEYCVEESWTKLVTLRPQGPQRSLPRALCFRKSGEVVMVRNLKQHYGGEEAINDLAYNYFFFFGDECHPIRISHVGKVNDTFDGSTIWRNGAIVQVPLG